MLMPARRRQEQPIMDGRAILEHFPLPIARLYRRLLNASPPRDRHDLAYYLFEVYLKYVASIAIAAYLAGEGRDHRVNAALKGLARPSLGEWLRFLRECLGFLRSAGGMDPALAALADLLLGREGRWDKAIALHNAILAFRTGAPGARKTISLAALLAEVVAYRNRVLGHGAPLSEAHYRAFADLLAGGFEELAAASPFLAARRLVSFDSIQVREGSRVECQVMEYMGLAPARRPVPHAIPYGAAAPRERVLYLLAEDGALLCLDPLLVACGEDVYLLNEATGVLEYLSYATGEHYRPPGLEAKEGDLFDRILGYRIDSSALDKIEEDLAPAATAASSAPEPGERRLGDYRVLREIGHGGMGAVYEAVQESLGRRVALKVLPGSFALEAKRVERFRREARATARIHHPNIVPVYEVGEERGSHFYAMEYLAGPSLDRVIAEARASRETAEASRGSSRHRSLTAGDAAIAGRVERMAALAEGLAEAHRQGLIHRDVKPSNILVGPAGRWVLVDFGLVHDVEAETLTRSGEMVGTLRYMSPEQVSRGRVDARADVHALGATLYEALTLRVPFDGENDHEVQRAILFEEPVPPRRLNPRIGRDLETVILHALEKNPEKRYASAAELAADLRRYLRGEPILARARPPWQMALRRLSRHRGKALAAASLLLVTAAAWCWPRGAGAPQAGLPTPRRLLSMNGSSSSASLSSDGRRLAFINDTGGVPQVWVKSLEGDDAVQVTNGDVPAGRPRWCPAGDPILFHRVQGQARSIWAVSPSGGEPRRIVEKGWNPSWSWDGRRIVYESGRDVLCASADGSGAFKVEEVPALRFVTYPRFPAFSPDGSRLAIFQPDEGIRGDFHTVGLSGGSAVQITHDRCLGQAPAWLPDGKSILFSSHRRGTVTLWMVAAAGGEPTPVTAGAGEDTEPEVSRDGRRVIYTNARKTFILRLVDLKTGTSREILRQRQSMIVPKFSPRGDRIAFQSPLENEERLFVIDSSGKSPARLIGPPRGESHSIPLWAPDGEHIYFTRLTPSPSFRKLSLASGESVAVMPGQSVVKGWMVKMDPLERYLAYTHFHDDGRTQALLRDLKTGTERDLGAPLNGITWSHDGKLLAGMINPPNFDFDLVAGASGTRETIAVLHLDGGALRKLTQGMSPLWGANDSRIYFRRDAPPRYALWSIAPDGQDERKVLDLEKPLAGSNGDVSVKDEYVYVQVEESDRELWVLEMPGGE
jgi:serine/threonine protein kinase/Tol biopolymer transport system component